MTLPCLAAYGRPPTFKQVPADSPRSGGCQRACQQQNRGSRRARRCGSRVRAITAHKLARVARQGEGGALRKAADVAGRLGAKVVVVHPPFRWQRDYAREFEAGLARLGSETDVVFAVENMFPLRARGTEVVPYAPHWNPVDQDYQHVTLDLSHTAVSGSDALEMAGKLGSRLAHVHLADGSSATNRDEHLVPGRGGQPCARLLEQLAAGGYPGVVVLEVGTRRALSREDRRTDLAEALAFTRLHLTAAAKASGRGESARSR